MRRFQLSALRYPTFSTQLELSFLACVVFSTLIAVALGIHFTTLE